MAVAAAMVSAATELCRNKTPAYNATPLREQQLAQEVQDVLAGVGVALLADQRGQPDERDRGH